VNLKRTALRSARSALLGTALLLMPVSPAPAVPVQAAPAPSSPTVDLFAFAAGAQFVTVPSDTDFSQMDSSPLNLIDGTPGTDWTGEGGHPAVFVLELAETTELARLAFDTAGLNRDEKSPRAITVEVSSTSPTTGFSTILATTLRMKANNQSFAFAPDRRPVGRWVRLTVNSNYGDDYTGFTGFRGYGRQLTAAARMPEMSGTYDGASGWGTVNITQSGQTVTGCYAHNNGRFHGTITGRRMTLDIVEDGTGGGNPNWRGVFGVSPDGRQIIGLMRGIEAYQKDTYALYYSATRVRQRPGSC
jgi:hypothetical protein